MLKINLEYKKGILFVRLKGNLNETTAPRFREYALPIINDYKIKYIIYNLNNLQVLDNVGKEVIKESSSCIKKHKGKVLLINSKGNKLDLDNLSNELVALELLKI